MPRELTFRSLLLGAAITTVFTAANVYLGLKVGITFASSIPAAVISMALLSLVRDSSILENNIVQTVASAAGTLSAIIFVLPGLVIVGWWAGFPFWTSFLVCVSGGVLGVLFTIPLRRALVTTSDLPYPEGVAAAEVLKVGSGRRGEAGSNAGEAREGLVAVILGSVASAGLAIFTGTRIAAAEVQGFFQVTARSASGYDIAWSLALFGAGHLVGLSVGLAMFAGLVIAWVFARADPDGDACRRPPAWTSPRMPRTCGRHQVRFIGAGAIGISSIWTLVTLARPVVGGLMTTLAAARGAAAADERDRDLAPAWIYALTVVCLAIAAWLAFSFLRGTPLEGQCADAHDRRAAVHPHRRVHDRGDLRLHGRAHRRVEQPDLRRRHSGGRDRIDGARAGRSTRRPARSRRSWRSRCSSRPSSSRARRFRTTTCRISRPGSSSAPRRWRQQVALIVGVVAGAAVIPPVLNLLAKAYGFAGAANVGVVAAQPLPAPQATLISALAQGVIGGNLNWTMIGVGAIVGVGLIVLDEVLRALKWMRIPPLAVGIGIYLPMSATFAVVVGAVVGHWYTERTKRGPSAARAEQLGTLVASGLIVGESLFGVLNAGLIVALNTDAPLALVPETFAPANVLGLITFSGLVFLLYRWMLRRVSRT